MAVRGAESKELITKTILNIFSNSFIVDGKEIRIPTMWNGEEIQIKVALTAAKTNIEHNGCTDTKQKLPENIEDIVPIGPLTDEQKNKIIEDLKGIIDIDFSCFTKGNE